MYFIFTVSVYFILILCLVSPSPYAISSLSRTRPIYINFNANNEWPILLSLCYVSILLSSARIPFIALFNAVRTSYCQPWINEIVERNNNVTDFAINATVKNSNRLLIMRKYFNYFRFTSPSDYLKSLFLSPRATDNSHIWIIFCSLFSSSIFAEVGVS